MSKKELQPSQQKSEDKSQDQIYLTPLDDEYYFNEDGLMVMRAKYLLRRGYCCNNKCKHCPY